MNAKLKSLYEYRELLYNLTRKEVKVKYKNSVLGILWSMINPLIMLLVYYVAFGILFKVQGNGIQYFAIYLMSGILPWNFLQISLITAVGSVVSNGNLVKKVYFPREVLPISHIGSAAFNFILQSCVLFAFMAALRYRFSLWILAFPLVMLLEMFFIAGMSFFLSAINVVFRDVQHLIEVVLMAWFWLTPIIYPVSYVTDRLPEWARTIYFLNPMAHIIALWRQIVYNPSVYGPTAAHVSTKGLLGTAIFSVALAAMGYYYFTRKEGRFAEFV